MAGRVHRKLVGAGGRSAGRGARPCCARAPAGRVDPSPGPLLAGGPPEPHGRTGRARARGRPVRPCTPGPRTAVRPRGPGVSKGDPEAAGCGGCSAPSWSWTRPDREGGRPCGRGRTRLPAGSSSRPASAESGSRIRVGGRCGASTRGVTARRGGKRSGPSSGCCLEEDRQGGDDPYPVVCPGDGGDQQAGCACCRCGGQPVAAACPDGGGREAENADCQRNGGVPVAYLGRPPQDSGQRAQRDWLLMYGTPTRDVS